MDSRKILLLWFTALILISSLCNVNGARKSTSRHGGSKPRPSHVRPTQVHNSNQDLVKLSYSNQHSAPPKPSAPQAPQMTAHPHPHSQMPSNTPSAPVMPHSDATKPIGWNVQNEGIQKQQVNHVNSAPYPTGQHNQAPFGSGAQTPVGAQSPPYPVQNHGQAPPPYSSNAGVPYTNNAAPPQYSPVSPPGHQTLGAGHPPQQGYQPSGGYPQQSGYQPNGGYPQQPGYQSNGGYPQQPGYQQQAPGYSQQAPGYPAGTPGVPVINHYETKSGGGSGLTNALLVGVGGLSLYNALKPGEEKTVIVNHYHNGTEIPSNATASVAPPAAENSTNVLVANGTMEATTPVALAPLVSGTPIDCSTPVNCTGDACNSTTINPLCLNATTVSTINQMDSTTMMVDTNLTTPVPLAPLVPIDTQSGVPLAPFVTPTPIASDVASVSQTVLQAGPTSSDSTLAPAKQKSSSAVKLSLNVITILATLCLVRL